MPFSWKRLVMMWGIFFSGLAGAQSNSKAPWEEYDKLIHNRQAMTVLGPTLFGDQVDLYSGALSFSSVDIEVPGNALNLNVVRSLTVGNRQGYAINDLPFADWDLEVPRLSGVFASTTGWASACTHNGNGQPPMVGSSGSGGLFLASEYWHGNQVIIPGRGRQDMLVASNGNLPKPGSGGPYTWLAPDFTYFSCIPQQKNASGEGFLAITPDGVKYWFDWQAQYMEPVLERPDPDGSVKTLGRRQAVLYATRVEDRFGNWINYTYTNAANAPATLASVSSSDGRAIVLSYNDRGHISQIRNGTRSWTYHYSYPSANAGHLSAVDLPDGSHWSFDLAGLASAVIFYEQAVSPGDIVRTCGYPGFVVSPPSAKGTITHPSGAIGEFTVSVVARGRSNVPRVCNNYTARNNDPNDDIARYAMTYDGFALTQKRLSGPGIDAAEWNYAYGGTASFAPGTGPTCTSGACAAVICKSESCSGSQITQVSEPEGIWVRYTFGNSYRYNEGKLLKVEKGSGPTSIEQVDTFTYLWPFEGQQFATRIGNTQQERGDGFSSEYLRPESAKSVSLDGVTFNRSVSAFDAMARPLTTTRWSSLGFSRQDVLTYYDRPALWTMGQILRQVNSETGKVVVSTDYDDTTALPVRQYAFGKLQQTLSYSANGLVASVADAGGNTTTVSSWKRGIPESIRYADGNVVSAAINDMGWIESTTDANGYASTYGYDAMGRLTRLSYPAGDEIAWNSLISDFRIAASSELGLASGHWRVTTTQGNKQVIHYLDALWRPVVEETFDQANRAATSMQVIKRYDRAGRLVFQSYPQRGITDYTQSVPGTRTQYDMLGRATRVERDAEGGVLATTMAYLAGFQRQTTDPRGNTTTERFQVFDQPSDALPVMIDEPEGVSTAITRDIFGKPLELLRSGPDR
ncbi:RHS repeat protein [Xanthomonas vasicola]|uniref:RHS repeat protein n=1 Tax=Xanthomonas vasicola TaxID=56459 RepID=UPI0002D4536F|nr:RHS repeat protein [Xanthomonas vasicola]MBV6740892.1 wall associated protein [Xanthomonas vasicola pv. musacearum NCPPB 2251]MBV7280266.1 wall associated protein [Xanthomonas vasicola pv. musacearum]MBV7288518.1 wall associated protein [Xanthomonas vasicola pv. musacearum]